MLRGGFDLTTLAWLLNALALSFGALLGLRAFFDPHWAARFVRLKEDQPGGFAEFRATYGGVFLGVHAAALIFSFFYIWRGNSLFGLYASAAAFVLALGWGGACAGRLFSYWRDAARTRFNLISAAVEAAMALLIALPWVVWALFGAD